MRGCLIAYLSYVPFAVVCTTIEWSRLLLARGLGVPAVVRRGAFRAVAWLSRPPLHASGVVVEVFPKLVGVAKCCFCALYHLALVVGVPCSMRFVEYQRPTRGATVGPCVHGGCRCVCGRRRRRRWNSATELRDGGEGVAVGIY